MTTKSPVKSVAKKAAAKKAPAKKKKVAVKKATKSSDAAYLDYMKSDNTLEILRLADDDLLSNVTGFISTQSLALNKAIGHAGVPRGRLTEISGDEHAGKSTVMDHILAETQRMGGIAILLDPEVGRDAKYTRSIGVEADKLLCPQPKEGSFYTLQSAIDFIGRTSDFFAKSDPDRVVTIGLDSIAGLPTDEDLVRAASDVKPGEAAKTIRHGLRNIIQRIARSNITLVFVNQVYDQIGGFGFGDKRREYGGRGIRYHASVRIRLSRAGMIKTTRDEVVGSVTQANVLKTKISGRTGAKVKFGILHGRGIDNSWTLFEALKAEGYITGSGAWFRMQLPDGTELKWTGKHWGLAEKIHEHADLYPLLCSVYESCVAA